MSNESIFWILLGIAFCIAEVLKLLGNASNFIALFKGISAFVVVILARELSIPLQIIAWFFIDIALWQFVSLYKIIINSASKKD